MKLYKFESYNDYIDAQKNTTDKKYGRLVYVRENIINGIYQEFKNKKINSILCHGTRSGEEQKYFKKYFNCYVMGSELSEKAESADMTTIWDFNKENKDWVGNFDLVYTNALDHCINPTETLGIWKDQLTKDGNLLIEWSDSQNNMGVVPSDPLNATSNEIVEIAESVGLYLEKKILEKKAKHAGTILVLGIKK